MSEQYRASGNYSLYKKEPMWVKFPNLLPVLPSYKFKQDIFGITLDS